MTYLTYRKCARSIPLRTALALGIALLSLAAKADDKDSMFKFSGFGSLGVVRSTEKNADFVARSEQPTGAGYSHDWWAGADSRLGGQVDGKFGAGFSGAVQVTSSLRAAGNYKPEVSLAMLKWQATNNVSVRAGRLFIPVFSISDYREVSYAQPWVRPPVEMYQGFTFQHFDGADISGSTSLAGVALKAQAYYGKAEVKAPGFLQRFGPVFGLALNAESGSSSYRASFMRATLKADAPALDGLFNGVRNGLPAGAFGPGSPAVPGNPAVADEYQLYGSVVNYFSIAYTYDPGDWFVTSEAALSKAFSFVPDRKFGYLTAGLRYGAFTPYATVARVKPSSPGAPSGSPIVDSLRAGASNAGQSSLGLGLRWDVMKNVDIKTQIDRVRLDSGSPGLFINVQPGFQPGSSSTLFSAAVSFVF